MNSLQWSDAIKLLDGVSDALMQLHDQFMRICQDARSRRPLVATAT
jgi:hypothetical protein